MIYKINSKNLQKFLIEIFNFQLNKSYTDLVMQMCLP